MKRLLIATLILLAPCASLAGTREVRAMMGMWGAAGSAPASFSCDAATDADLICEDFGGSTTCATGEAATCRTAWSGVSDETYGTVVTNAPASITGCTDETGYGIQMTYNGSGTTIHLHKDLGSSYWNVYVSFMVYIESESLSNSQQNDMVWTTSDTQDKMCLFSLIQNSSGELRFTLRDTENGDNVTLTSSPVTTGTWYHVQIKYNRDGENQLQFWLDGSSQGAAAITTSAAVKRLLIGATGGTVDAAMNYTVTSIKWNSDALPDSCN